MLGSLDEKNKLCFLNLTFSLLLLFLVFPPDAINLLPLFNDNQTNNVAENEISSNINQIIDRNNFTLMFRIRSKVKI
jgi:hypothetical protein